MMERHDNMISRFSIERLEMRAGAVTELQLAAGDCLTNRQGKLWITRSNDSHDYWLLPGNSLCFPRAGVLLLEAYGDSALTIEARRPAEPRTLGLSNVGRHVLQRVLRALAARRFAAGRAIGAARATRRKTSAC